MMTPESIGAVLDEVKDWTNGEWELVKMRIDEHFAQKMKKVEFGEDGRRDVSRLIAMDNDWPIEAETPQQTKMGF